MKSEINEVKKEVDDNNEISKNIDQYSIKKYNRVNNEIVNSRDTFSVFNNKIVRLISNQIEKGKNINRDLFQNMEITIPSEVFINVFGNTNFEHIAKSLSNLQKQGFIRYDEETKEFESFKPFYYTRYVQSENKAVIKIVREAVIKLAELNCGYAQYELKSYLDLQSYYSQRIYELLSSNRDTKMWIVKESKLRGLLNCSDKYQEYKAFHRDVITKAQKEIAEKTEIEFTYDWDRGVEERVYRFVFHIKEISRSILQQINAQVEWFKGLTFYDKYTYSKEAILPQFKGLTHAEINAIGQDEDLMVKTWELKLKIDNGIYKIQKSKAAYLKKTLGFDQVTVKESKTIPKLS